ncbi:hypothetical protein [Streptomyces griseomycini]|uniref:Uncharacterized protein n=1 Tax=Streptomyces griseomycini TaxID=66895 RepID=A0A7W7PWS7_9ACTN|nr:hypothetical protein [Streptomyces griseomycini]MBB4902618.1 hypothetical protein [Streptomyces griseomycini]GGR54503.1 hypothetical protein GCM10015536_69880 [Streptomyces griseomycini]
MPNSFATLYGPLVGLIYGARARGDEETAQEALAELLEGYARLERCEIGTVDEQNEYIITRNLGALPEVLEDLGVTPDRLPPPAGRRSPTPPAAVDTARLAEHFARLVGDARPEARFTVDERPQDGMRYQGRPAPYAVVDRTDGLPVAWYPDRDWASVVADTASRLRRAG